MQEDAFKNARILIIDAQEADIHLLEGILGREAGYKNLRSSSDPRKFFSIYSEFMPDLILLDLRTPYVDGFALVEQLKSQIPGDTHPPILVSAADMTPEEQRRAVSAGADDFLIKPFAPAEVLLRIRNHLQTRFSQLQLKSYRAAVEVKVRERTLELEDAYFQVLDRLAHAAEYREDDTGEHPKRVGQGAAFLARALELPQDQVILIRGAAPLHDVGKIAIPDHILLKPGPLTSEEFAVMKSHTTIGAKILSGGRNPILQMAEEIALTHHEHWDGTGYPQGLTGDAIPLTGRIVAIVEVFDALTHMRPYRESWPAAKALAELQRCAGTHFDPWCVDAFLTLRTDTLACSLLGLPAK